MCIHTHTHTHTHPHTHLVIRKIGLPWSTAGKEPTCNAGDPSSRPGLGG